MSVNIKDFILKEIPCDTTTTTKTKTHNKTEYDFVVEYENDCDFILRRVTQNTSRLLVCLVSQGQIYIKDEKKNTIETVKNIEQLNKFKLGMETLPSFEKLIWQPFAEDYKGYWGDRKYYRYVTSIFDDVIKHLDAYKFLANKKLNPFENRRLVRQYENDPDNFNKINETLKIMRLLIPTFSSNDTCFNEISRNLKEAKIDYNMITNNIDIIRHLGVDKFKSILSDTQFATCMRDYGCDFKALLNYLLYTITYRNGLNLNSYSEFRINQYADYLRMQHEMYGKVKEKYPTYWLSEKQMMIKKYNDWRSLRELVAFELSQEKMKQYEYEYEDKVFKVIVPMQNTDILDEAEQQQHCVASYIDRIKNGETHIVFIRQRLNEKESCLTVEITPDARIIQVKGFQNRNYTALEYAFMKEWAKEKNLKLEVPEVV